MRGICFSLIVIFFVSFSSATFACGIVHDSSENYAYWVNVISYYGENPSKTMSCKVNPENKFCCDIEEIKAVSWRVGKPIFAEIFDEERGLIGGPVQTSISGEGVDIFPDMDLEEVMILGEYKKILIGEEQFSINLTLHKRFSNLRYEINSSESYTSEEFCYNCTNVSLLLPLSKGKNEIKLTAHGDKEISKTLVVYSLDYLDIERTFICDGCNDWRDGYRVRTRSNVLVRLSINSSHDVSGLLTDHIPIDWEIKNSSFGSTNSFSDTHKLISFENFSEDDTVEYLIESPRSLLPRKFEFMASFENKEFSTDVWITLFPFLPDFLHIPNKIKKSSHKSDIKKQTTSEANPLVEIIDGPTLEVLAIYTEDSEKDSYIYVEEELIGMSKNSEKRYSVSTNLYNEDVNKFVVRYKVPSGFSHEVLQNKIEVTPSLLKSDSEFDYYEVIFKSKDDFVIKSDRPNNFFSELQISFSRLTPWILPNHGGELRDCFLHFGVLCNFQNYFDSGGFLDIFRIYSGEESFFLV